MSNEHTPEVEAGAGVAVSHAVVGLGSNLGGRQASIDAAVALVGSHKRIGVLRASPFFETAPLGPSQPWYLNAAVKIDTGLSPLALLGVLLEVEARLGRVRDPQTRWGPRAIDLDLLWYEHQTIETSRLTVPHPELEQRSFALAPLLAVAPELETRYGAALLALGAAPPVWPRAATTLQAQPDQVTVRASSEADGACLAINEWFNGLNQRLPHERPSRSSSGKGRRRSPHEPRFGSMAAAVPQGVRASSRSMASTIHRTTAPSAQALVDAAQRCARYGVHIARATVSACTNTQWQCAFHGDLRQPIDIALSVDVGPSTDSTYKICLRAARGL